jgi:hypothetical protein
MYMQLLKKKYILPVVESVTEIGLCGKITLQDKVWNEVTRQWMEI